MNSPVRQSVDPIGPFTVKEFKKVEYSGDLVWVTLEKEDKSIIGALASSGHNLSKGQGNVFVHKVSFNTFALWYNSAYIIIKEEN